MTVTRTIAMLVALVIGGAATTATAASAPAGASVASPARIGSIPHPPRGAQAFGSLASTTTLHVDVVLQPRDPTALAEFATNVSTPGSPLYGRYLARGQFPAVFGPTQAAITHLETALRAAGLHLGVISPNHLSIPVTASAAQLAHAFSTNFRRYRMPGGRIAFANTAAPLVPGGVASLVQGVVGLDNLYLPQGRGLLSAPRRLPSGSAPRLVTGGPQPCAAASTAASAYGAYTADELASAYGLSGLYGVGDQGATATVAVYELEPNLAADISAYQACYGTSASVAYTKVDAGAGAGAGSGEAALDIEDVIGLAPKAHIQVYQGPNNGGAGPYDTYSAIISADSAQVISTSWGLCEPYASSAVATENVLFEQAASQGQSIFSAAGDSGSEDCNRVDGSTSLAVDDPASQPYVTGVGGTTLSQLGPPPTETAWNAAGIGAGGGGISAHWAMPSYQAHAASALHVITADSSGAPCGVTLGDCREAPDVSAAADPYAGYVTYFNGSWTGFGGTSAAAPLWAALAALTDASSSCHGTAIGFANPALYRIAGSASYARAFQDITVGNNDYTGTNAGLYPAGTGYDMVTGLGTPDASGLAALLCPSTTLPSVTTTATSNISPTTAILNGTVNPNGAATTYQFEYGTTTAYGSTTTQTSAGSGTNSVAATAKLIGLRPGTTYDVRLVATNPNGTADAGNQTFTTSSPTTTSLIAAPNPAPPGAAVTLVAAVSPAGAIGTAAFLSGATPISGCTAAVLSSGTARCVTHFGAVGTYHLVARYSGGAGFDGSTSASRMFAVSNAKPPAANLGVSLTQIAAFVVTHYAYANWRHAAAYWASAAAKSPASVAGIIARSATTHVSAASVAAFVAAHYAQVNRARLTHAILSLPAARQVQILASSVFPARIGPWRARPARVRAGYSARKIGGLWWEVRV